MLFCFLLAESSVNREADTPAMPMEDYVLSNSQEVSSPSSDEEEDQEENEPGAEHDSEQENVSANIEQAMTSAAGSRPPKETKQKASIMENVKVLYCRMRKSKSNADKLDDSWTPRGDTCVDSSDKEVQLTKRQVKKLRKQEKCKSSNGQKSNETKKKRASKKGSSSTAVTTTEKQQHQHASSVSSTLESEKQNVKKGHVAGSSVAKVHMTIISEHY